ncbi:hypothetical protein BC830DRAFT_353900 [Chytriomyces sp. MP71]|nr:hypothetical protein BC830DRAFT_353900 [Chytriomyces sp. MP71]
MDILLRKKIGMEEGGRDDPYTFSNAGSSSTHIGSGDGEDEDEYYDPQQQQLEHEERVAGPSDLYAVLNVDREASDEDIRNAYRRLSMTFHPDKHQSPQDKERAQVQFQAIKRAYDVLSNPSRRHLYNTYGADGIRENQGWDVASQRNQTAQEVREEFERQQRMRLESEAERLVKSKGEVHVGIDATALFDGGRRRRMGTRGAVAARTGSLLDAVVLPEMSHAFVKHSWETKVTDSSDLTIQGSVIAKNGVGAGTIAATVRNIIQPTLWSETTIQASGKNPSASVKFVKNFTSDVFATAQASMSTLDTPPPVTIVLGRKLDAKHTGFLTFRSGDYAIGQWGDAASAGLNGACALGIVGRSVKGQWSAELSMGPSQSSLNVGLFRTIGWGIRARAAFAIGTGIGISTSVSADKKITKLDRVGMSVDAASIGGVSFKLRFMRLGQKFVLPIQLTPQLDLRMAVLATIVPLATALALDQLVLLPNRRARVAARLSKLRQDNAALLAQRREDALAATALMAAQVARKREAEEAKNGLVVVEAVYGVLPASRFARGSHGVRSFSLRGVFEATAQPGLGSAGVAREGSVGVQQASGVGGVSTPPHMVGVDGGSYVDLGAAVAPGISGAQVVSEPAEEAVKWIDVTVPVQALVFNSQLYISGNHSKAHIVGFYDPCLGEAKKLRITYKFQGKLHQVEVDDLHAVAAPLRAHSVSEF